MGKKGNWFGAVKRAFSHESKEKREERKSKSKKKWLAKHKQEDPSSVPVEIVPDLLPPPPSEEVKLTDADNEQSKHASTVALASAVAAEEAAATAQAAQAAQEVVRLTTVSRYSGKSKEEVAAIKIQTAFRGYLARRALRALRGLVRLKTLIDGQSVKRQATTTLRCMQTLARVQSQIRARRIRMSEENQALQRQLQQKHEKELETLRATMGDDWNDSLQSKEQIEAKLLHKHEAAMRRERALAYAFSHQQTLKNSSRSGNPTFMDPNNPHWGWSWLERWMAARPWETSRSMTDKELNNDHSSLKSATPRSVGGGEISKAYARRDLNPEKPSPSPKKLHHIINRNSPSTPPSKAASSSSVTGKVKPASSHGSLWAQEEDTRSSYSMLSDKQHRRHSVAGSSIRDDESLTSSPAVPSYMAPTESARAKTRFQSPLGIEKHESPQEKVSVGSAKKRLSFTASPAGPTGPRRHSGPPKVESVPFKDIAMHPEQSVSNGGSR